jgi:shikimate dehydrogenase
VGEADPFAVAAGAVNTIKRENGQLLGFNTDGIGLVRDLEVNQGWELRGATILVIGAGGASSGVAGPLLAAGVGELVVANRTPERASQLVKRFCDAAAPGQIRATALADLSGQFDVVINATSAGLGGAVPEVDPRVVEGALCYDMVYGRATAFCTWAAAHGAKAVVDGVGMLVEQAAEAFLIWRDVRPETGPLLATLRMELAQR